MGTIDEVQKMSFISRREYERIPFVKKLTVKDLNTSHRFDANGVDISVKGVGFVSPKILPMNSRVSIQVWLDDDAQKDPVWIGATVKWAKPEQDGAVIGVQFDTLIEPVEHPKLYEMIYKVIRLLFLSSTVL